MRPTLYDVAGGAPALLTMHAGNGPGMNELGPRFLACFDAAMDDAGLPADQDFRDAAALTSPEDRVPSSTAARACR
jgi:hemoglobin